MLVLLLLAVPLLLLLPLFFLRLLRLRLRLRLVLLMSVPYVSTHFIQDQGLSPTVSPAIWRQSDRSRASFQHSQAIVPYAALKALKQLDECLLKQGDERPIGRLTEFDECRRYFWQAVERCLL